MEKVNIDTVVLLETLRKNRETHVKLYEDAIIGYRNELIKVLKKMLKAAKSNEDVDMFIDLTKPLNHVSDYDRVIKMLEMTTDKTVSITEKQFEHFVMDKWSWKAEFLMSNSKYLSSKK